MYWQLVKVLFLTIILHAASTGMRFTATLDALKHGATSFEVGAMLAMVALVPALFALSAGRWLDRVGPRTPTYAALLAVFIAGTVTLMLPTDTAGLAPLFAACLLVGVSFMLSNCVCQRLTGEVVPREKRTTAFSVMAMTASASGVLTPVITGYAIEHIGFYVFYAWCIGAAVVTTGILVTPAFSRVFHKGSGSTAKAAGEKGSAKDFLVQRGMRNVLFVSVMISVAWEVGNLMIPVYCAAVGRTPSEIGWILGSFAAATFAVRLLMPLFLRFLRDWQLITGTLFIGGVAFAAFPFFSDLFALMAVSFFLGMGLGASFPNILSLMYRLSPAGRIGEAIGLRLMLMNISKTCFPVLMGAVGAAVGAGAALWGLAAFLGLGGLYALKSSAEVAQACRQPEADSSVQTK